MSTDAYAGLMDALQRHGSKVEAAGSDRFMAQCPAHEDGRPSLSVRRGDRCVLLHCFAGCDGAAVVDALGLTLRDLYDTDRIAYTYGDGLREFVVTRATGTKGFRQSGDTKGWADGKPLYRVAEVSAAVASGEPVWFVEGEKDADLLCAAGACATTNAGGADNAHTADFSPLAGAHVRVLSDLDTAGDKHRDAVVRLALEAGAATVAVWKVKAGKDYGDHHAAGFGLDDLEHVADTPDTTERFGYLDWSRLWAADEPEREWVIPDLLPAGGSGTIYAPGGVGKSLLALDWSVGLVTGGMVNGQRVAARTVLYIDLEQDRALVRERLESLGVDQATDLCRLHYSLLGDWPPLDTAVGGRELLSEAQRLGADLVVIDTASRVISTEENSADTWLAFNRHTGRPLKRHGHALLRLDHAGKDPAKGQRGSSAKEQDVDQVYKLEPVSESRVNLRRMKNRLHLDGPDLIPLVRVSDPLQHRPTQVDNSREEKIGKVLEILDNADVPADVSRRDAEKVVKAAGMKVRTQLVGEALRRRRLAAGDRGSRHPSTGVAETGTTMADPPREPQGTAGNQAGTTGNHAGNHAQEGLVPDAREPVQAPPPRPRCKCGSTFGVDPNTGICGACERDAWRKTHHQRDEDIA